MVEPKKLLRYSRELVMSCREPASRMNFPSIVIPIRIPRGTRKKSQSTDTDGNILPGGSPEDLNVEEVDSSWQRPARQPWHHNNNNASNSSQSQHPQSGYFSSHSRQRYPSGPHMDISQTTANISLRAAPPSDNRRGGHGDWSRGCAGWRQRSYSGSERSELVSGTNFRGRGTGGGHFGLDGDETTTRGRGRGRAGGRYALQHRGGPGSRGYHSSHGGHRPVSFIGPANSCDATEEFWQDEDWDSVGLDGASNFDFPSKPRERLNSKTSVEGLPANVAVSESSSSAGSGPNAAVPTHTRDPNKTRVHSKSCSAEPPPGFDASSQHTTSRNPHPSETPVNVSSQPTMGDTQAPNPPLHDVASSRWYYIDSVGRTQGPFIRQQMSAWLTGGYLPLTIEVRRDCDECFLTLGEHINLTGRVPFSDGYPLPPLNRSNLPALVAASKKPVPNPRWINTVAPPNPQPADFVVGPPPFSPSVNNVMAAATAAAAPALALFFATAASLTTPASQQSPQPLQTQPQSPSVQTNIKSMPSVVDSPKPSPLPGAKVDSYPASIIGGNPEILRLYTEAQALAAHAAKVEAERQELADKLAAINSTAAKLLAASPGLSMATTEMVDSDPCGKVTPSDCAQATHEVEEYSSTSVPIATAQEPVSSTPPVTNTALNIDQERHIAQTGSVVQHSQEAISDRKDENAVKVEDNLTGIASAKPNQQQATFTDQISDTGGSKQPASDADVTGKKAKKKNKKSKKKITPEQERQLAWDAEFERRKAAALERKLAEEAELQRIADEEAAAAAAEEQAQMKEQLRLAAEQRKREVARAKASNQLGQLRLPKTSCWGGSATTTVPGDPGDSHASSSLLAIQAAQAMEEAERKKHDALLAEQAALLAEAEAAHQKTQQAWASVVNTTAKGAAKQAPMMKSPPSKSEFPAVKGANQNERTKSSQNGNTSVVPGSSLKSSAVTASTGTTKAAVSGTSASTSAVAGPSIWDLPGSGKTESATSTGKNSKKHNKKKSTRVNREAASYAAKEQLAHWCESQLSSMPLSGVDLPTLVDLLCELEAAEQVVEFIETSLGRSKQISQFSKAFLEKRACVLNVP